MKLEILNKEENKVLSRTKIKFQIVQEGRSVPSRISVHKELVSKLKKPKELIIIRKIEPVFGSSNIKGEAYLYSSKEVFSKVEPKYTVKRLKVMEEKEAKKAEDKKAQESESKPEEKKEAEAEAEDKSAKASEPKEEKKEETTDKPEKKKEEKSSEDKKSEDKKE